MKLKKNILTTLAYLYLLLPLCIFLLGWVKSWISIPIILLACYCFYGSISNFPKIQINVFATPKKSFVILIIICTWVLLSGIGGFVWQNWDHIWRNAVFRDLYNYSFPVIDYIGSNPVNLCYYFGFWLPAALVAKVFGNITVGWIFLYIWSCAGVILAFLLISEWIKKLSYKTLLILILFSGIDIVFHLSTFFHRPYSHIELNYGFQCSSNTTLLFWVFNQTIPFWVGMMLLLLQTGKKYLLFTFSLLLIYSTFPTIALVPAIIYLELKESPSFGIKQFVYQHFTLQNICGVILLLIVALFYKTNLSSNKVELIDFPSSKKWIQFVLYFISQYFVYLIFVYKEAKRNWLFIILFSTMFVCTFFRFGFSTDFQMRTCIPAAFYLMLLIMKNVVNHFDIKRFRYKLLLAVFLLGSATPFSEMLRTIKYTTECVINHKSIQNNELESVFIPNDAYSNFIGSENSFFNKYIRK